jgi:NADH-quinone oxidoreductase subunit N
VNIPTLTSNDLLPVVPAALLTGGAIVLLMTEAFLAAASRTYQAMLAVLVSVTASVVAARNAAEPARSVLQGFAVLDPFSSYLTMMVCAGTALAVLLAAGFLKHRNAERGEFYALVLFSAAGMSLLALSAELITLFINLEVMSISTYALTAFLRRGPRPSEAGFKYFILGAFASSLMLYGSALLYGATGTTMLVEIGRALPEAVHTAPGLVYAGFGLLVAGFAFKVAAVPFHMWTPDVYEGAPTPVTALMSVGVKAAAFVALIRAFIFVTKGLDPQIPYVVFSVLAVLTMVGGNLLALPQRSVKRMLAYSSVAHAGYLLLGVAALFSPPSGTHSQGLFAATPLLGPPSDLAANVYRGILFYLLGYTVTAIGAFGTLGAIERREDESRSNTWDLDKLAGLAQRQPGWAAAMAAFMLSLAGVPPTVGFLGKLLVFGAAVEAGMLWLAVVGILTSVVGVYFYLRVVVYMYMRPAPSEATAPARYWTTELAIGLAAVGVIVLGVMPGPVTTWFSRIGMLFGG